MCIRDRVVVLPQGVLDTMAANGLFAERLAGEDLDSQGQPANPAATTRRLVFVVRRGAVEEPPEHGSTIEILLPIS